MSFYISPLWISGSYYIHLYQYLLIVTLSTGFFSILGGEIVAAHLKSALNEQSFNSRGSIVKAEKIRWQLSGIRTRAAWSAVTDTLLLRHSVTALLC